MSPADLQKALERHLEAARYTLDYYEGTFKQLEEKSRNNVTLGTGIVTLGALIVKTDDVFKMLGKSTTPPAVPWAVLAIALAVFALLALHYTNIRVLSLQTLQIFKPENLLQKIPSLIIVEKADYTLDEHLETLTKNYANFAKATKEAVDKKACFVKIQPYIVATVLIMTIVYITIVLLGVRAA